jgi:hypothetical protein
MVAMVSIDPSEILNSMWLKLAAVLVGTAILGGFAYWQVRRRGGSVARVEAQDSDDPADKTRRMLVGGRAAEKSAPAIPSVSAWKAAHEAVEAYADPELRQAKEHWSLKCKTASEKEAEAQRQIQEIKDKFPDGIVPKESDVWPQLEQAERQQRATELVTMHSEEEVRRVWLEIRADINKKLCAGTLVSASPWNTTRPLVGVNNPVIARSVVDFPAPLAPMSVTTSPALTVIDTLRSARMAP